ncbi:hypothetical protein RCL1_001235 [Eukaryota sp. TZLM3-RCL]
MSGFLFTLNWGIFYITINLMSSPPTLSPDPVEFDEDGYCEYVMIRSSDGPEFVVPKHIAEMSSLIKRMLDTGTFAEASSVIRVPSTGHP